MIVSDKKISLPWFIEKRYGLNFIDEQSKRTDKKPLRSIFEKTFSQNKSSQFLR